MITITFYFNGPALGVAIYARELLNKLIPLLEMNGEQVQIICSTDAGKFLENEIFFTKYCFINSRLDTGLSRVLYIIFLSLISKDRDIFLHLTNPIVAPFFKLRKSKIYSVIHDLNEFDNVNKYGVIRSFARRYLLKSAINNSNRAICISNHTKKQVEKHITNSKNLSVIYNGAGSKLPILPRNIEKLIVIVGRIDPHGKNLWSALKLIDSFYKEDQEINAIFTGGINNSSKNEADKFLNEIQSRSYIKYIGRSTDEQLSVLYSKAEFLLFISKLEGFGLPAFEALRAQCPVVASIENSALIELLPKHLIYIHDNSKVCLAEIRSSIININWDESMMQSSHYSWDRSAKEYSNLLSFNK